MPKRHRQPEPIDIGSAAHQSKSATTKNAFSHTRTSTGAVASSPAQGRSRGAVEGAQYSPGELQLVEETRRKAMDFPATPETLTRHRKQQEAVAKRRRMAYDHDGQAVAAAEDVAAARTASLDGNGTSAPLNAQTKKPSSPVGRTSTSGSEAFDLVSDDDDDVDGTDLSSDDYIGDDGNQGSSDSASSEGEGDDAAELRGLHKAMKAAAAAQRRRESGRGDAASSSSESADAASDGDAESGNDVSEDEERASEDSSDEEGNGSDISDDESVDEEVDTSDLDDFGEEGEEEEDADAASDADHSHHPGAEDDDDDDDADGGMITVDFGVFDMEQSNIDGLMHLMDQLCPDKMNEVDRDELGLALYESPFTSVVRLQNNGEDATGEEEQEFYGLSSVLDVAHGQQLYPHALRPLCELLQQHVWRQAASGIPPTDILTSVVDDEHVATSRAKAVLLIAEYIRNIPLELTVQILEDVLDRLDAAGKAEGKEKKPRTAATHDDPIFVTHPSMFAVLAKVQRATDAPVTLPQKSGKASPNANAGAAEGAEASNAKAAEANPSSTAGSHKKPHHHSKKHDKGTGAGAGGGIGGGSMGAPDAPLDLQHYIFWREEDSILYEFRDRRVAALVYRCRPQYDGQPEHEIPLSLFYVLQYGAVRQAVDEMKRRQTMNAAIERY